MAAAKTKRAIDCAAFLKVLSDQTRLAVVRLLIRQSLTVRELYGMRALLNFNVKAVRFGIRFPSRLSQLGGVRQWIWDAVRFCLTKKECNCETEIPTFFINATTAIDGFGVEWMF